MSKEQEDKQEPKNYGDYGYVGDEEIVISVEEFIELQKAINQAMTNGVVVQRPQIVQWVNAKTGKEVKFSMKAAQDGTIKQLPDTEATASEENISVSYDNNIFPHVYNGNKLLMGIHYRHVEAGVAKPTAELKRVYEERQAKGQMKIQDEEGNADVAETVTDRPQPSMNVVKDAPETQTEGEVKE